VLAVGLLSFTVCITLGIGIQIDPPHTHDEFGYLLIADTFAHGRVTNPSHPFWPHFESVHILQQPSYTSKYPPAQGLVLALGEVATGVPMMGVWLATALASATVCWMLLAWMRPRWALVGGLMTALHPQMIVWSQNYWGGAVALAGGAIVLGAFRRILREAKVRDAIWLGIGMAILANSRPYEGFVFSLLICLTLAAWMLSPYGPALRVSLVRVGAPVTAVMMLLAFQVGYYNYRITGSALRMPYAVCEDTYGIAPLFIFQQPKPEPQYRHAELRALQLDYLQYYRSQRKTWSTLIHATWDKVHTVLQSCLWSLLLLIPLAAVPWAIRGDRWLRLAIPGGALFSGAMLMGTWVSPHYAAPAAGLFVLLVVASMRQLKVLRWGGRPWGLVLQRSVLILCALSTIFTIGRLAQMGKNRWDFGRQRLLTQLAGEDGRQLAFVQYSPNHNPHREWVYNPADLDGAKVVLARIMSPEENARLAQYYGDRHLWVIDADAEPPTLAPLTNIAALPHPIDPATVSQREWFR